MAGGLGCGGDAGGARAHQLGHQVLPGLHRRILGRVGGAAARGQTLHHRIVVNVDKKGHYNKLY